MIKEDFVNLYKNDNKTIIKLDSIDLILGRMF